MFRIIAGIQREGTTVLMVEQNAYMALQLAARAYVMETGRITLEGPAGDLMQNEQVRKAYLGGWPMTDLALCAERVPAAWGSAGAMSGPPQLKSLKDLDGGPPHHHRGDH